MTAIGSKNCPSPGSDELRCLVAFASAEVIGWWGSVGTSEQVTAGLPQGEQGSGLELGQRFRHTVKGATSPADAVHVYLALVACGHCPNRLRPASAYDRPSRVLNM